jgi:hypothetical protein
MTSAMPWPALVRLGDESAAACEGDHCEVPGAPEAADPLSGNVEALIPAR